MQRQHDYQGYFAAFFFFSLFPTWEPLVAGNMQVAAHTYVRARANSRAAKVAGVKPADGELAERRDAL